MTRWGLVLVAVAALACGGGSGADSGTDEPDSAPAAKKRIFVTDATWEGQFWVASPTWPESLIPP
jgi:hypothetical protein